MKLTKGAKNISKVVALLVGGIYFFGGIFCSIPQVLSEILWGFSVFFACIYWFTEEKDP